MAERTWIEISARALDHNVRGLAQAVRPATLMPILKANAYGHGLNQVLPLAKKWPIWGLGLAYGSEALAARRAGFKGKILVLSAWEAKDLLRLAKNKVELVVYDFTTLKQSMDVAGRGTRLRIHIKIDAGTTRIGFLPGELSRLKKELQRRPSGLRISGLWSHFSSSEKSVRVTRQQLRVFHRAVQALGLEDVPRHIASTAAGALYPNTRLDLVRSGVGVYGYWPGVGQPPRKLKLRPALRWLTKVIQVKKVSAGTSIGYGQTFQTKRLTTVAVLPVGYADGLRRALGNRGQVLIAGRRCPIVGRVCMNLTMVDVSQVPSVRVGTIVTLLGVEISADEHASWSDTISYEILTGLSPFIPRIVV